MNIREQKKEADVFVQKRAVECAKEDKKSRCKTGAILATLTIGFTVGALVYNQLSFGQGFLWMFLPIFAIVLAIITGIYAIVAVAGYLKRKKAFIEAVYKKRLVRLGIGVVLADVGPKKYEVIRVFGNVGVSSEDFSDMEIKYAVFDSECEAEEFVNRLTEVGATAGLVMGPLYCSDENFYALRDYEGYEV